MYSSRPQTTMRSNVLMLTVLAPFLLAVPLASPSSAAERETIQKLLDAGWGVSLSARRESDRIYREAVAEGQSSPQLLSAMMLVQMRQRRYPDALNSAKRLVNTNPADVEAHQARTWLAAISRQHGQALLYAEALAAKLPEAPESKRATMAEFLGRILGYYEAVNPSGVTMEQIRESANRMERSLGPLATAMNEGRRESVRKYQSLTNEKDASVAEAEAAAEEERERKLREIAERQAGLKARREELQSNQDRLSSELSEKLAEVNSRLAPLNQRRAQIESSGQAVNYDLGEIVAEIRYLESLLTHVRDPILRDRYRREILHLDRIASRLDSEAYRLEQQAYTVDAARTGVAAEGIAERNRVGAALDRTERELSQVERAQKRNRVEEQRARRPDRVATRTSRLMKAQIVSLSTYAAFPLERARLRLLEDKPK